MFNPGEADRPVAPSQVQDLSRSNTPIQANLNGPLGQAIDQAITGSQASAQQLQALLSNPSTAAILTAPPADAERNTRTPLDTTGRGPRPAETPLPSMEQIQAIEAQLAATQPPSIQEYMAQLTAAAQAAQGQPAQQPQLPQVPQLPPGVAPQSPFQIPPTMQMPGAQPPIAQAQAAAPAPATQPPPQEPEWLTAIKALAQQTAAQGQMMQQFIEAQYAEPAPRQLTRGEQIQMARDELAAELRVHPNKVPAADVINYLNFKRNEELAARIEEIQSAQDNRWQELGARAQGHRQSNEIESSITHALAPHGDRGAAARALIGTNVQALVDKGATVKDALTQVMTQLGPLLSPPAAPVQQQAQAQPVPVAQPQIPQGAPQYPAHIYQVPGYAGVGPLQFPMQQQAMAGAAIQGNGAGRYNPAMPSLESMDVMMLQLGRNPS